MNNITQEVLSLLKVKYGWDFFDSLTKQGEKLVRDTISALKEVEARKEKEVPKQKGRLSMTKEQILNKWLNKY